MRISLLTSRRFLLARLTSSAAADGLLHQLVRFTMMPGNPTHPYISKHICLVDIGSALHSDGEIRWMESSTLVFHPRPSFPDTRRGKSALRIAAIVVQYVSNLSPLVMSPFGLECRINQFFLLAVSLMQHNFHRRDNGFIPDMHCNIFSISPCFFPNRSLIDVTMAKTATLGWRMGGCGPRASEAVDRLPPAACAV